MDKGGGRTMESRKAYVDMAKFFGIFIVLMNHIGLSLPYVNFYGGMFYVPIFFVAAGYTYKRGEGSFSSFVKKKARRLLIPYFVYNGLLFLFFTIKGIITHTITGREIFLSLIGIFYSRNSLFPLYRETNVYFMTILNSPTWFLTALFLSYILFEICIRIVKGNHYKMIVFGIVMLFTSVILHYLLPVLLPWSLESIPLFYCFLLAGYLLKKYDVLEKKILLWFVGIGMVLFLFTASINGSANISVGNWGMSVMLGMYNGIYSSFFLLWICKIIEKYFQIFSRGVAYLGRYTLSVLCLHMFILAILQTVLDFLLQNLLGHREWGAVGEGVLKVFVLIGTIACIVAAENLLNSITKGEADEGKR